MKKFIALTASTMILMSLSACTWFGGEEAPVDETPADEVSEEVEASHSIPVAFTVSEEIPSQDLGFEAQVTVAVPDEE